MRLLYLPMLRCYCLWLALLLPAAGHAFSLTGISDASVMENTAYNSPMPAVSGSISGAISYALISDGLNPLDNLDYLQVLPVFSGMNNFQIVLWLVFNDDSSLFSADAMTGVVSMPARWADPALDKNGDNIHNVILVATDSDGNKAALHWQVTLQEEPPLSFAIAGISNSTVYENTAWVSPQPVITDRYLGSISYSLAGNDAALFTVNSSTGVVSLPARDFENPQDQNLDNRYDVTLLATDSKNNQASLAFSVTVLDLPSLSFTLQARHDQVDEGQTYQSPPPSTSGAFRPPLTYYLEGPDSALFGLNSTSGRITLTARNFANPSDADGDNIYRLTLWAVDSDNNSASVDWTVTVRFVLLKDSDGDGVLDPFEIVDGSDPGNPLSFRDRNANGIADAQENDADSDGIDNITESGGIDPYGDHNNDGVPNYLDPLDRGDGLPAQCTLVTINNFPDATDGSPTSRDICDIHSGLDPLFDQDQDGVPNFRDSDSDGDLIPDIIEAGTDINGVPRDTDGDGVADFLDIDSDGDGIPDIVENMPYSVDSNNNGIADVFDAAIHGFDISPAFQGELVAQLLAEVRISEALASGQWLADQDNDGVPNYRDIDSDGDGIPDALEGTLGRDTLANGIDDMYDVLITGGDDDNGDGIDDAFPCHDTDGDGQCDYLDSDSDNDCISDFVEAGASGHDFTLSGYDDAFDACFDGDGKHDGIHSACLPDSDGDGAPDHRDLDSDNDAIIDVLEAGRPDDDGNGQCDAGQALITDPAALPDSNNDSIPDLLSLDSNGDGIFDIAGTDHAATDSNNDGRVDLTGDADKDGIDDRVDNAPNRFGLLAFDPEDPDFCDNNPDHPDCEEPVDCDADPDHPDCDTPVDCDADPDHPDCDTPVDCDADPEHPDCDTPVDCDADPDHPDCDTPVDCDADPDHPDCDTPVNPVQPGFGKIKTTEQGSAGLLLALLAAVVAIRRRLLA